MFIKSTLNNSILLNIYLKSSNNITLYNYKNKIESVFKNNNINYKLNYLPNKTKQYSILRSPHVYKKSLETFEEKIYKLNFRINIINYKQYLKLFYILKFIKNNMPLNINITFKLSNNVKTIIL
nr:ribosomal protein S10 [Blastocystis sp. subtype 2]APC25040.1 ribosomal protein S10 [Blastocystis sp. subtype 2]